LERGTYPGSKSITGGRLYLNNIRKLMPELWGASDAPLERNVSAELITFMKEDAGVSIELSSREFGKKPSHSCTVLRTSLDQWLAANAEEKGALIVTKTKADEILKRKNRVTVKAGDDEVSAKIAILAEGSNNLITTNLKLSKGPQPRNYAVGVKEVIELPEETIDERFNLDKGEGAAQLFIGSATKGLKGGGFLYTNKGSLSLGIVVAIDAAMTGKMEIHRMFDEFKGHQSVSRIIKGGKSVEYSAQTIPEGGFFDISKLRDGNILVTGDAAGLALNMGFTVRGMDLAIASGHYAAIASHRALEKGNLWENALSEYERMVEESFIFRDMHTYRNMNKFLDNHRVYDEYPQAICSAFENIMRFDGRPKKSIRGHMWDEVKNLDKMNFIKDLWGAFRWL
jgi:electron transfer flavoprotein-quinone oxidoreductase